MIPVCLAAVCLTFLQSDPEEIRRGIQQEIERAKARLERLDAAMARAQQETEEAIRAVEAGPGSVEEKAARAQRIKGDQGRLAVTYYHLGEPSPAPVALPTEAADLVKKSAEQVTAVLRAAEAYYQSLDRTDTSKTRAFVYDAGWQVGRMAEGAAATSKQAAKGIRVLPDERPVTLLRANLPDPLEEAARLIESTVRWNAAGFSRVASLAADRRSREASEVAQRLLDANRVCLARLRRAQMILESFSQAQSELDDALERSLPVLRAGALGGPAELAKLQPARDMLQRGLQFFLDGLAAQRGAVEAATKALRD